MAFVSSFTCKDSLHIYYLIIKIDALYEPAFLLYEMKISKERNPENL